MSSYSDVDYVRRHLCKERKQTRENAERGHERKRCERFLCEERGKMQREKERKGRTRLCACRMARERERERERERGRERDESRQRRKG
ncbi:hypothetical protein AAT19DRAFT_15106 [Rhodotorula toruloides]|uniref:Uncharacterized protein n=1 Tax=Rhodotorula toruloides TaxID=5286 RepID=A0A2T0A698_RHOTO|nr:hypothetical protein AAT19DRAFT_15106 [Rhodotorula toruloides]